MAETPTPAVEVKRIRLSQTDVPAIELERSLRLASVIWDQFAGRGARPLQVAEALDIKPSSGGWRELTGASIAYGLTEGGYNAQEIRLTDLGRRIVAPRQEGDDRVATAEACLTPRVSREFLTRYDGAKFPADRIAASVLVDMGVPKERTGRAVGILRTNAEFASLLRLIKGEAYVELAGASVAPAPEMESDDRTADMSSDSSAVDRSDEAVTQLPEPALSAPKQIFIAHGKRRDALEALKQVLDKFKVPYVVAVDEPNAGRPISEKVAQLMRSCSAGYSYSLQTSRS
jgi:hypothetical protein